MLRVNVFFDETSGEKIVMFNPGVLFDTAYTGGLIGTNI
jgi:hypothetical protein